MHRRDIDGLRAVAVCAVIANHFSEAILPGGYLGVDIFFVISGFVITLSLLRQTDKGGLAFLSRFYQRRIRRILPALLVCVLVSAPIFALVDPSPRATLMTGATSLFGFSNFYLFRVASDYFSYGTKLNGFTHTWSLGVEEQFYLVYPALFWLLLRQQRNALIILSGLAMISLAGFAITNRSHPIEAFFLLPYRAWELAIGALLARFQTQVRSKYASIGLWLGVAVLCASLATPSSVATLGTVAAVMGSGLLIHFGGSGSAVNRFLLHPVVQWIGGISYSLYLWHWTVLALSRWTIGIRWWLVPVQLALMFALAAASYRLVEQPLRKPRPRERAMATILGGLALSGMLAVGLRGMAHLEPEGALFAGQPVRLMARSSESVDRPFTLDGYGSWQGKPCVVSANDLATFRIDPRACTLGNDHARHHALVIGNSFTGAFLRGFVPLIRDEGYAATFYYSWSASPSPTIQNNAPWASANFTMWHQIYPELARTLTRGDLVILTSSLGALAPEPVTAESREALKRYADDLSRMSAELRSQGVRLVVVHSLPFINDANCRVELGVEQWFTPFGSPCNFASRSHEIERRTPIDRILRERERNGEIVVVDFFDLFCPGKICGYTRPDIGLVYRDNIHPSVEMMPLVGTALVDQLKRSGALSD